MASNKDIEIMVETAKTGEEIRALLDGRVGRYLIQRQREDEAEAIEALLSLDPYSYKTHGELVAAVAQAQEAVTLSRKVNGYLHDALINAEQAETLLHDIED